ncbi:MAG TPA: MMPL family transporter [Thermoleophilaceae bacterium]|jgi:RND superfamily putative drug exporter
MSDAGHARTRSPKRILIAWGVVIAILASQAGFVEKRLTEPTFFVPDTPSKAALDLDEEYFGPSIDVPILLEGPPAAIRAQGRELIREFRKDPRNRVIDPWAPGTASKELRPRPDAAMIPLIIGRPDNESLKAAEEVQKVVEDNVHAPVEARLTGEAIVALALEEETIEELAKGELYALPILLIVLLLVFRSVVAAAIPAVFGALTVLAGYGTMAVLAEVVALDATALSLASMLGLALGVDYTLLMVSRFREELAGGADVRSAAAIAAATSGRTVVFAGVVLLAAMVAAVLLSPGSFLVSGTIGVGIVTVISAASARIAIPALLELLGERVNALSFRRKPQTRDAAMLRVASRALRRPFVAGGAVLLALMLLAAPALGLDARTPGVDLLPSNNFAREDYERVSDVMGAGWGAPYTITVANPGGPLTTERRLRQLDALQRRLGGDRAVATVFGPGPIDQATRELGQLESTLAESDDLIDSGRRDLERLEAGLADAGSGAARVQDGLDVAAGAARQIADGTLEAEEGSRQIAAGVDLAREGFIQLREALLTAARGADRISAGQRQAEAGGLELLAGLRRLTERVEASRPRVQALAAGLGSGASDLERLREPAQFTEQRLRDAWEELRTMTAGRLDPRYEATVRAVGEALAAASGRDPTTGQPVREGYDGMDASLRIAVERLRAAGDEVNAAVKEFDALVAGARKLRDGAAELADGLRRLRAGGAELADGLARIVVATSGGADGMGTLAAGAHELADGLGVLSAGTGRFRDELGQGARRVEPLVSGLARAREEVRGSRDRLPSQLGYDKLQARSPELLSSGYLRLAAIDGAHRPDREGARSVINLDRGGQAGRFLVIPSVAPGTRASERLGERLQREGEDFRRESALDVRTGGQAQLLTDFGESVRDGLPRLILGLSIVTYVVLAIVLRSLLMPLIGVALNVLTVGVSFGILALLYEGSAPLGGPGYIDATAVLGIFGVMFGLSIDYQVFLLARMREGWERTGEATGAIDYGLTKTARVVTGAALIMAGVFLGFSLTDFPANQQLGIGLIVAILLDATIVRLVVLPCLLKLCGDWAWWMPARLDRAIARVVPSLAAH